jgi:hypothetical protein
MALEPRRLASALAWWDGQRADDVVDDMVTSPEYRDVPTGTLAILAQQLCSTSASVMASMPTAPRLRFTRLHASHRTSRL